MSRPELPVDVVENPWTGEVVSRRSHSAPTEVDEAVATAHASFRKQSSAPAWRRIEALQGAAAAVEAAADELVALLVSSLGKPRRAAAVEVRRSAAVLRACAEEITRMGGETIPVDGSPAGEGRWSLTFRQPYGVAALVTPFNAPLNLLSQKLGPALAMGNTVVVKPSPEGADVTERFVDIVSAHLEPGTVSCLFGGPEVVLRLVADPRVRVVSLTGGNAAGEAVLAAAGVKPVYLELGSNSPNIVLADADLDLAAGQIAAAAFEASGQQCISAQRILVERSVAPRFVDAFVDRVEQMVVGDPADPTTDVGPVIHSRSARRVAEMIADAEAQGATVLVDGRRHAGENERLLGPTVLTHVPDPARLMCEEAFGPVAVVREVDDLGEAIDVANDVPGLLQASCFTASLGSAMRAGRELWAGSVWINEATRFRLDGYPFGGTGTSGIGREGIPYALEEFSQLKHVGMRAL